MFPLCIFAICPPFDLLMMFGIAPRKLFTTLLAPFLVLSFQLFIKWYNNIDISYVGISLAAIAMGQMLPFALYDHFMLTKVFIIKSVTKANKTAVNVDYQMIMQRDSEEIDRLRILTTLVLVCIVILFILTVTLAYKEEAYLYHNLLGGLSVIISTWYILDA